MPRSSDVFRQLHLLGEGVITDGTVVLLQVHPTAIV